MEKSVSFEEPQKSDTLTNLTKVRGMILCTVSVENFEV